MPAGQAMYDPDISTARTLTLVVIILQSIFFVIGLVIFSSVFALISSSGATFPGFGIFGAVFGLFFVFSFIWIPLDYFLVYRNLYSSNTAAGARTPALVLGIIQLLFGGTIPGILLILAYVKIGDSMARRWQRY
jgi:hypothetical protein